MNQDSPETINGVRVPYEKPTAELIRLLEHPVPQPWVAYHALARKTDSAARQALLRATQSADWRHRRCAAEAMGYGVVDDEVESAIRVLLEDDSANVVRTALDVVGKQQMKSARPRVIQLMNSEDSETRRSSVRAMAAIAAEHDVETILSRFRSDGVEDVRREAGWALHEQRSASNWRMLVDEWKADPLHRHRAWACELVAEFGGPEDLGVLAKLQEDPDGHVRKAAAEAKRHVQERGGV